MNSTNTHSKSLFTGWNKIFISPRKRRVIKHYNYTRNIMIHYDQQCTQLSVNLAKEKITPQIHTKMCRLAGVKLDKYRNRMRLMQTFGNIW